MKRRIYKSMVILILLMLLLDFQNIYRLTKVANATEKNEITLEELNIKYKRLNDELWEVKQSRDRLIKRIEELEQKILLQEDDKKEEEPTENKKEETIGTIHTITCYDLSEDSNGTWKGHKYYGLTANGFDLRGHTWESARTVAVDKNLYPLGTKLKLTFIDDNYAKYNGIYTARDTGGAIKGYKLDLFLGDFNSRRTHSSVWNFGKTKAYVEIVK